MLYVCERLVRCRVPLSTLDALALRRRSSCCPLGLHLSSVSVSCLLRCMGGPGYAWGDPSPHEAGPYYDTEAPPSGFDPFASLPPRRKKRSNLPCLVALLMLVLAGTACGILFGVVKIQDSRADRGAASSFSSCVPPHARH